MGNTEELFGRAAAEAVEEEQRLDYWTVFSYYDVRETESGKAVAVAPQAVPEGVEADLPARRTIQHPNRGVTVRYWQNVAHVYQPLADKEAADLFFRFARRGERGVVAKEKWTEWVRRYGVLGVLPNRTSITHRNAEVDAYPDFVREASLAGRTLELFEAATAKDGPNVAIIAELLPEEYNDYLENFTAADATEQVALWAVGDTIQQKVLEGCYPRLVSCGDHRRTGRSPLAYEWAFNSLLGAMWLQFMWLTTAENVRRCAGPACNKVIDFERPDGGRKKRKDAKFCSGRCRFNHYYYKDKM